MPDYFKKRRGSQGPNKNEQKIARAKNAESRARLREVLSSQFPSIKHLQIRLTFLDARQHVLEEKTLAVGPSDAAEFTVSCPGRCGKGSFDFRKKIIEAAAARLPTSESSAKCLEPLYAVSGETCGCEIRCRMDIDYFPVEGPVVNG